LTLPSELVNFVLKNLHSIEQVEILLLLLQHLDQGMTIEQIDLEIKTNPESIKKRMHDLQSLKLVEPMNTNTSRYCMVRNPENLKSCQALANYYGTHRQSIIELIYSRPSGAIGSFVNAFRIDLRGKKE